MHNPMKKLLYYLITATGVVFLFGAFETAPSGSAPGAAITASTTKSVSSGACMRTSSTAGASVDDRSSTTARTTAIVAKSTISPEVCAECHKKAVAAFYRTTHAKSWQNGMGCEQCHGDLEKHVEAGGAKALIINPANLTPQKLSEVCLKCHEKTGEQSHIRVSEHARAGVACVTCHVMHPSGEEKSKMNTVGKSAMIRGTQAELCLSCHPSVEADLSKPSHHKVLEGAMNCTSCHNPHGADKQHQLRADTKTLCVSCHQDKRGPFMYEHNAMANDGCMACHENHGSAARNMLKVRDVRELCESCHSADVGIGPAHGRANLNLATEGDCTRCHMEIHGSNRNKYFIN